MIRRAASGGLTEELLGLVGSPWWWFEGLCAQTDPELFFPEKGGSVREAKRVCAACPVRAQCLEHALAHDGPRVFRTAAWWLLCCLLPVQVLVVDLKWGLVAES